MTALVVPPREALLTATGDAAAGAAAFAEYALCLGYAALAIKHLCAQPDLRRLLPPWRIRGIAVGFDEGDFVLLRGRRR